MELSSQILLSFTPKRWISSYWAPNGHVRIHMALRADLHGAQVAALAPIFLLPTTNFMWRWLKLGQKNLCGSIWPQCQSARNPFCSPVILLSRAASLYHPWFIHTHLFIHKPFVSFSPTNSQYASNYNTHANIESFQMPSDGLVL
jgi:hypothetical protein